MSSREDLDSIEKGLRFLFLVKKRGQKLDKTHTGVEAHCLRGGRHHAGNAELVKHRDDGRIPGQDQFRLLLLQTFKIDLACITEKSNFYPVPFPV